MRARRRGRRARPFAPALLILLGVAPSMAQDAASTAARPLVAEEATWFVDAETGERYQVTSVPRVEGSYRFLDAEQTRVRLQFGLEARVERVEEDRIWIRVYRARRLEPPEPASPAEPEPLVEPVMSSTALHWSAADDGLPQSGLWREGLDLADFDGDGRLDLVLAPARKSRRPRPRIYRHLGDGRWRAWTTRFPDLRYDYGDVAVADFDRDGYLDVALGMHLVGLEMLRGSGDGGFEPAPALAVSPPVMSRSLLALTAFDVPVLIALGEGMAGARPGGPPAGADAERRGLHVWTFDERGARPAGRGEGTEIHIGFGDEIAAGDPAGDGTPFLAFASRRAAARELVVVLERGADGLQSRGESVPDLRAGDFVGSVAFADTDGDGRDELYVGSQSTQGDRRRTHLDRYRLADGVGSGWVGQTLVSADTNDGIWSLAAGDVDGDGRDDLVAGTGAGEVWVLLSSADGELRQVRGGPTDRREGCVVREVAVRELGLPGVAVIAMFAGESSLTPEGLPVPGTGCPAGGRVAVWSVLPVVGTSERAGLD